MRREDVHRETASGRADAPPPGNPTAGADSGIRRGGPQPDSTHFAPGSAPIDKDVRLSLASSPSRPSADASTGRNGEHTSSPSTGWSWSRPREDDVSRIRPDPP